jgi:hypothetical protein
VSSGERRRVARVDMVDARVAAILRRKPGAERLKLAHEEWALTRKRLVAFLIARHPDWDAAEVEREVAKRLLGGPG